LAERGDCGLNGIFRRHDDQLRFVDKTPGEQAGFILLRFDTSFWLGETRKVNAHFRPIFAGRRPKRRALTLVALISLAGVLRGQTPVPETKDPLGRTTPQEAVFQFLEACHARDYSKAAHYLDLRRMPAPERAKQGPELAAQLEDLLDDTPFDITVLSRDPEGDTADGLSANREHLDTFRVDGQTLELQLERVELRPGYHVWLVAYDSLPLIPKAHQLVTETAFEKKLPQTLVTFEVFATPIWRWIALILTALVLSRLTPVLAFGLVRALRPVLDAQALRGPLGVLLAVAGFRAALELAPPATLSRLFIQRALAMMLALGLAWAGAMVVDLFAERWRIRIDPRMHVPCFPSAGRSSNSRCSCLLFSASSARGDTTPPLFWRDWAWAD